jgi:hypothetical protein
MSTKKFYYEGLRKIFLGGEETDVLRTVTAE